MGVFLLGIYAFLIIECRGYDVAQASQQPEQGMTIEQRIPSTVIEGIVDNFTSVNRKSEFHELDMLITDEQRRSMEKKHSLEELSKLQRKKRKAIKAMKYRWTGNVVPYMIPRGGFSIKHKEIIRESIGEWQRYTCLRFIPRNSRSVDFVAFVWSYKCSSKVGMRGRMQYVRLSSYCISKGTVLHEIGHVLGLHHEHNRPDRNSYVKINWENIKDTRVENFFKEAYKDVNLYGIPYDYDSIMHYSAKGSSKNGKVTIKTLDPKYQKRIGKSERLSFYDIKLANLMYSCGDRCTADIVCPGEGFVGKDCQCYCPGNPVQLCSQKLSPKETKQTKTPSGNCRDKENYKCQLDARRGYCLKYRHYMKVHCRATCNFCNPIRLLTTGSPVRTRPTTNVTPATTRPTTTVTPVTTRPTTTDTPATTRPTTTLTPATTRPTTTDTPATTLPTTTVTPATTRPTTTVTPATTRPTTTATPATTRPTTTVTPVTTRPTTAKTNRPRRVVTTGTTKVPFTRTSKNKATTAAKLTTTEDITQTTTTTTNAPCRNSNVYCNAWASRGYCRIYKIYMYTNCQAACSLCKPASCADRDPNNHCYFFKRIGSCVKGHRHNNYMKDNCSLSCGYC
ncbi:metalloendopeptidase [Elysia marginata]|uniref:Metalloendopeptidase n=1 Tax=Elysia marginata TaxID=1093978 RepID=A0AAV4FB42_9GAST|nr:metalloendopeptidase [Elysia marginata]